MADGSKDVRLPIWGATEAARTRATQQGYRVDDAGAISRQVDRKGRAVPSAMRDLRSPGSRPFVRSPSSGRR